MISPSALPAALKTKRTMKKLVPLSLVAVFSIFSLVSDNISAQAPSASDALAGLTKPSKEFPNITISNFGKMDDRFYRGARPKEGKGQFSALKSMGIETVIDLTDKPRAYEKAEAEAAGLRYVSIPMSDSEYPEAGTIETLTKTMNDPATGVFYVHCAGGRHRTGIAGAIWRFTKYGWNYDQVYAEMKNYDFYTRWGHGDMKTFVQDYAAKMETAKAEAARAASSAAAGTLE
jgi:protein tyrosine/serine phosphatase